MGHQKMVKREIGSCEAVKKNAWLRLTFHGLADKQGSNVTHSLVKTGPVRLIYLTITARTIPGNCTIYILHSYLHFVLIPFDVRAYNALSNDMYTP